MISVEVELVTGQLLPVTAQSATAAVSGRPFTVNESGDRREEPRAANRELNVAGRRAVECCSVEVHCAAADAVDGWHSGQIISTSVAQ